MKNLTKYTIEFLAIFLAISLGFIVDEIREKSQNDENYNYVLRTILSDIKSDTAEIKFPLHWANHASETVERIMEKKMTSEELNNCTECRYSIVSYSSFHFNTTGFNLLNSGIELSQIENRELLSKILEFYSLNLKSTNSLNGLIDKNALANLEYFRDNCSWFSGNWADSATVVEMSAYLLNDKVALARTRHTQILIRDNFLPKLKSIQEDLNELSFEIEKELENE